jgi:hypothetical protein
MNMNSSCEPQNNFPINVVLGSALSNNRNNNKYFYVVRSTSFYAVRFYDHSSVLEYSLYNDTIFFKAQQLEIKKKSSI